MRLYYTPRSHYSRKVRMLMGGLHLATELVNVGNVAESNSALFGENPLMKVPTLVDGDKTIFDSDNIAQYLVRTYDRKDTFQVLTTKIDELNARSVMNGVMAAEVELIMAERTGMDTKAFRRFDKMRDTILSGLGWLETHVDVFPDQPTYLGFHLIAMWDHLALYQVCPLEQARLRAYIERWSDLPFVAETKPM
jgi:glutathione S-transferase